MSKYVSVVYNKIKTKTEYTEFYSGNGEMVATYSNNGWTFFTSKAEIARNNQFVNIYSEAWRETE